MSTTRVPELGAVKTATWIKDLPGMRDDAKLYQLSQSLVTCFDEVVEFVAVSSRSAPRPMSSIIATDAEGVPVHYIHTLFISDVSTHAEILREAGYQITEAVQP